MSALPLSRCPACRHEMSATICPTCKQPTEPVRRWMPKPNPEVVVGVACLVAMIFERVLTLSGVIS